MLWVHDGNVTVCHSRVATMSCCRLFHSPAPAKAAAVMIADPGEAQVCHYYTVLITIDGVQCPRCGCIMSVAAAGSAHLSLMVIDRPAWSLNRCQCTPAQPRQLCMYWLPVFVDRVPASVASLSYCRVAAACSVQFIHLMSQH